MKAIVVAGLIFISGCVTLQERTQGHIGCPAEEIEISNEKTGFAGKTWLATCRGKRFYCKASGGPENSVINCAPEVAPR